MEKVLMRRTMRVLMIITVIFLIIIVLNPWHKHPLRDDAKIAYENMTMKRLANEVIAFALSCDRNESVDMTVLEGKRVSLHCGFPDKLSIVDEGTAQLTNNANGSRENEYPLGLLIPQEDFNAPHLWTTSQLPDGKVKIKGPASGSIESYMQSNSHWIYNSKDGNISFYQNGVMTDFY